MSYPDAASERAMTVEQVVLKALSGEIHSYRAAAVLGFSHEGCAGGASAAGSTGILAWSTNGIDRLRSRQRGRHPKHERARAGERTPAQGSRDTPRLARRAIEP
jgi:hypothetical protein